ncbi:MAG: WbuC family cupin fold metalloprotein [Rugosibacter sp.]|nr:WbuC family cupin fold metalloprotein [Rugosibacter sp.]
MLTRIDNALLDTLCADAAASPRRRKNLNLHTSDTALAHRLLNAVQTDSYIAPHRHLDPSKDETFVVLRGLMGLLIFDEAGNVTEQIKIGSGRTANSAENTALGADIPAGTWHTSFALVPDTVILEAKAGPYHPLTEAERAPWAPAENTPEAATRLASWHALFEV